MAAAMIVWLARLLLVLNKIIARMVPRLPSTLEACDELAGRLHPVLVRMRHVAYVKQVQVLQEEMLREHHLAVTAAPERVYPIGSTQKLIRAAAGLERGRGVDLTGVETGGRYGQVPADRSEFLERLSQGAGQHVRTAAMDAVIDTANLNIVQEVDSDDDSEEWPDEDDDDLLDDFDDVFTEDDYWEDQVEQLRREKADEETEKEGREELEQARRERWARRQKSMSEARETAKTGPVLGYARVLAGEVNCAFCAMLASRGAVYKTEQTAGFEAHDNCVVEGTLVAGPDTEAGFRRAFKGEIITLVTASGREVTVTPNHPILTDRGWVAARLLNEGDNLVCSSSEDRTVWGGPDKDHIPAPVEEVVSSLGMMSTSSLHKVPVSAEDFHGDGIPDSEVDVILPDRLLVSELDSSILEHSCEEHFVVATELSVESLLLRNGRGLKLSVGDLAATDSLVSGGSLPGSLFRGHPGSPDETSGGAATLRQATLPNPAIHDGPIDPVVVGEGIDGISIGVSTGKIVWDRGDSLPRPAGDFSAAFADLSTDSGCVDPDNGGRLLERLSGFVETDRLVNKTVSDFDGHVYNLDTVEGWYSANGIISSNCDCGVVCVIKGKAWDGDNEAALLQELWEDARDHPTEEERSRMEGGKQLQTPAARFRSRYTRLVKTGEAARFKTDKVLAAEDTLLWMRSRRFPGSSKGRKSA